MLRSNLSDYSDTYIAVKRAVDLLATAANKNDKAQKEFQSKNIAPFRSCISRTSSTLVVNPEDLDIVIPMYNPLKQSHNYRMISGSVQNYY